MQVVILVDKLILEFNLITRIHKRKEKRIRGQGRQKKKERESIPKPTPYAIKYKIRTYIAL